MRQIRPGDAPALFAVFSDAEVMRYTDTLPLRTPAEAEAIVQQIDAWYTAGAGIRWAMTLKGNDIFLGSCGFHHFDATSRRAEVGYELGRAHWRQGITSEAVAALLDFGFHRLDLHRIEAVVNGDNEPSKSLLRKLGFRYEGCLRQRFWFNGEYRDEHYFGLLREEYVRTR
ncbi:MAG TPA: GNAT family protein [Gemmatimonadales bacterium]